MLSVKKLIVDTLNRSVFLSLTIAGLTVGLAHRGDAQAYVQPTYNGCITKSNGSGGITFANSCNLSLSVQFVPMNGTGLPGQVDVRAGGSTPTGFSSDDERGSGGYEFYICPTGYVAVDGNDRPISKPRMNFQCKKQ